MSHPGISRTPKGSDPLTRFLSSRRTTLVVLVLIAATALAAPPSLATMKAALEKGDLDEASRQGVLAGPAIIEAALASRDRATVLAGIAAASHVEDRAELLEPLASIARGPDRRTAIPAARAAAQIARELSQKELTDDIADADVVAWRDRFSDIAIDRARWIEVRVLAVDAAAYLERSRHVEGASTAPSNAAPSNAAPSNAAPSNAAPGSASGSASSDSVLPGSASSGSASSSFTSSSSGPRFDPTHADVLGVPWSVAIVDPDPAFRLAVLAHVPSPTPIAMREPLAKTVVADADARVALAATAALCGDLAFDPPAPILTALGAAGITRVQTIVTTDGASRGALREAARCLAADKSKESAAALRSIRNRVR